MLAFSIITVAMISGLAGAPWWLAIVCGLGLATIASREHLKRAPRTRLVNKLHFVGYAIIGSVALGQATTMGSFAMGRVFSSVFVG